MALFNRKPKTDLQFADTTAGQLHSSLMPVAGPVNDGGGPGTDPSYVGFPTTTDTPNLADLQPIDGHPGQFTDGRGKGAAEDNSNYVGSYNVYDQSGHLLGENVSVVKDGVTTNYGYSFGTPIPTTIDFGNGSTYIANPAAPPTGGDDSSPVPPPSYVGFPAGPSDPASTSGGPSDVVDRYVYNHKDTPTNAGSQPATPTDGSMQFMSFDSGTGSGNNNGNPDSSSSKTPAGFTPVPNAGGPSTPQATTPSGDSNPPQGAPPIAIDHQADLERLEPAHGALPATQGLPVHTEKTITKLDVNSDGTSAAGGQTINHHTGGQPKEEPSHSAVDISYGPNAKPITVVSDTGSNINDGRPSGLAGNSSFPDGYRAGSGSDTSVHKLDSHGRPITLSYMDSGAIVEQVAGGTPYQVKGPNFTQSESDAVDRFMANHSGNSPVKSTSAPGTQSTNTFLTDNTSNPPAHSGTSIKETFNVDGSTETEIKSDTKYKTIFTPPTDINKNYSPDSAPTVALSSPSPAPSDAVDRFMANHTAATVSPPTPTAPSPPMPAPGITLPGTTPDSNVINLGALSPSAAADYIVPHGKIGIE